MRRDALTIRVEVRDLPPLTLSQQGSEAGVSLTREAPGRAGAAPTKLGRVSTARWRGSGERDGEEYARNQRHYVSKGYLLNRSRIRGVEQPRAGVHYPRSTGEFQAWFRADEDCLDYLEWLRWPGGFTCPSCGNAGGWRLGDGRFECAACHGRTSVTAGTIFDRTRTPLTVWFTACWLFATQKDGISAQHLQRALEIGSYPTAWAMLHRLRSVLVRPGRDRLSGTVQVDETFIGGDEPGLAGGRAPGKKVLTGIAVEAGEPKGIGRCRMAVLADGSAQSLHPFITGAVEPGSTVITDAWQGYRGLDAKGYVHRRRSQRAARAAARTPASCCLPCTGWRRWPSGGCWVRTRARSARLTCPPTWMSSSSGSTGGARPAAAWSSTGCSSLPPGTTRSASTTCSPARNRGQRRTRGAGAIRRAWNAPRPTVRGGQGNSSCSYLSHSG